MQSDPSELVAEIAKQPHLLNLISSEVSASLDKRLQERESRLLKVVGGITALVLFVGYAGIREMINSAANNAAETSVGKRAAEFEVPVILATLSTALARAEAKGSFHNTERAEMISSLEHLSEARGKGFDVTKNPSFLAVLEKVIDTMAASHNDLLVDRAYDLFPDECIKTSGIVQTLLPHYGRQAVSGIGNVRIEATKRFGAIERAASTHKIPEYALAHRALIDSQASLGKANSTTEELLRKVGALEKEDMEKAWMFWIEYATERWTTKSTGESQELKRTTISMLTAHKDQLLRQGFPLNEVLSAAQVLNKPT